MWRNEREGCTVQPGVEVLLLELIQLVDEVEAAVGSEELGTVRRQLRELDARSAMSALKLLDRTTQEAEKREARARASSSASLHWLDPNIGRMKAVERMMRDVVVMFIVNRIGARGIFQPTDAPREDQDIFLDTAEDINGAPMDHDLRAKLCLAYQKVLRHRANIAVGDGAADDPMLDVLRQRRRRPRQAGCG